VDVDGACAGYEQAIRAAGGIDLQLLGIGADGHIGFNEPTSSLGSRTRLKTLTAGTLAALRTRLPPGEEPPHEVITMGIGTILVRARPSAGSRRSSSIGASATARERGTPEERARTGLAAGFPTAGGHVFRARAPRNRRTRAVLQGAPRACASGTSYV
jgi:hypothetical protein